MGTAPESDNLQVADQTILGSHLRERRLSLGLTLKQVADSAGLSVGFISQIERGIAAPSLTSLANVSRVLGRHVSTFLALPAGPNSITRLDQRPHYAVGASALVYERVSALFPGSMLTTVVIHQPPDYRAEPVSHEGEELIYVLAGAITVEVDGAVHVLNAGDSLHFSSRKVHSTWNHTGAMASLLHTCTMDVFGDQTAVEADAGGGDAVRPRRRRKPAS